MESPLRSQRIVLAKRPEGAPLSSDFRKEEFTLRELLAGEVLLKVDYLSIDPYMRGRMSEGKSYVPPIELNGLMEGEGIGVVISSKDEHYHAGDVVKGPTGWSEHAILKGSLLKKLDARSGLITLSLGILGMPGMTAYGGLLNIGKPKSGETVVVAAATGPVGSMVGQIAKIKGARTVGIAGGSEKCAFAKNELGFDVVVDHRTTQFRSELEAACPKGIDVYFENVGGAVWDAVLPLLNDHARVPVCGLVSQYNGATKGEMSIEALMRLILTKSITLRGFMCFEFADQSDSFQKDVGEWISQGKIKYREDIIDGGLNQAPIALIGMLEGKNFGKLIVRL
jgi:NADPH-dependent curcumin reductase CurA